MGGRVMTVRDWLPRVPLGLYACARTVLIPGDASAACTELLEWPAMAWLERWRAGRLLGPARAPVQ